MNRRAICLLSVGGDVALFVVGSDMVKPPCPTRIINLLNEWMHANSCGAYADSDDIYEGEGYVIQHRGVGSISTSSSCLKKDIFGLCESNRSESCLVPEQSKA
jgi:hypothetical protein